MLELYLDFPQIPFMPVSYSPLHAVYTGLKSVIIFPYKSIAIDIHISNMVVQFHILHFTTVACTIMKTNKYTQ